MKIVTSNIEQFKIFYDVVYDVASETIELIFYPDRMTCAVLDRGKTRFFYVEYEMRFFDEYDVDEGTSICVSMEDMFNLMKLANKTDTLTLSFEESIMSAELESTNGNKRLFEFTLPSDFVESPQLPQVQFPAHIEIEASDIKQSAKDIRLVGTHLFQFVLSENSVTLMSNTMLDTSSFSSVKYAQLIEDVETGVTEPLTVMFTLEHIEQMTKFDKVSKLVSLDIGDLGLVYKFCDDIMGITVHGMIAPRIEVEDEY